MDETKPFSYLVKKELSQLNNLKNSVMEWNMRFPHIMTLHTEKVLLSSHHDG